MLRPLSRTSFGMPAPGRVRSFHVAECAQALENGGLLIGVEFEVGGLGFRLGPGPRFGPAWRPALQLLRLEDLGRKPPGHVLRDGEAEPVQDERRDVDDRELVELRAIPDPGPARDEDALPAVVAA